MNSLDKKIEAPIQWQQRDEIDLRDLFGAMWVGKWLIFAITTVFTIGSVVYALSLPNIYKSEALLAPAHSESGGGLGALAGQFGGLASLAGINLQGGGGIDKTTLAIEVMKSREFISKFIHQHDLLVPLMAAEGWDQASNQLILDKDIYNLSTDTWLRSPKPPRGAKPSMQEAYEVFLEDILKVSQLTDRGLVSVAMHHYSPVLAKQWIDWLIEAINTEMKQRELDEAKRSIAYLNQQLGQTPLAEMQSILYQLIEEQTKTMMFAEVRDEYVFKVIDAPIVPELKAKPKRGLICLLGSILGLFFSVLVVVGRKFLTG